MSDLSAWVHLIIQFEIPKEAKEFALEQIKRIEARLEEPRSNPIVMRAAATTPAQVPAHLANQSASTIANLMKELPEPELEAPSIQAPTSAIAAQALASRQAAIASAMSGKPDPGRRSPRKF